MTVDEALISRLAKLAKLAPSAGQVEELRADLSRILEMVRTLDELDLIEVSPLRYVTEVTYVLRPDESGTPLDRSSALANAPDSDGEYFRVPRVL